MSTATANTTTPETYTSNPCGVGEFCWYEVNSRNSQAATDFYTRLTGNTAEACPKSPTPYTIFSAATHAAFGAMEMGSDFPAHIPAHWMGYVSVTDIAASCAKAATLGGSICVAPTEIPIGKFAVITDPTGACFSLFQSAPGKTDGVNWIGPGMVCWNELSTTDTAAAERFYTGLFGWKANTKAMPNGMNYTCFEAHGRAVAAMCAKCPEDKSPNSYWLYYLHTNNIAASVAKATTLGAKSYCDVMEIPGVGKMAYFADPVGASFALYESTGCCGGNASESNSTKSATGSCGCTH